MVGLVLGVGMKPGDAMILDGKTHLVTAVENRAQKSLHETEVTVLHPDGTQSTMTAKELSLWMVTGCTPHTIDRIIGIANTYDAVTYGMDQGFSSALTKKGR